MAEKGLLESKTFDRRVGSEWKKAGEREREMREVGNRREIVEQWMAMLTELNYVYGMCMERIRTSGESISYTLMRRMGHSRFNYNGFLCLLVSVLAATPNVPVVSLSIFSSLSLSLRRYLYTNLLQTHKNKIYSLTHIKSSSLCNLQ